MYDDFPVSLVEAPISVKPVVVPVAAARKDALKKVISSSVKPIPEKKESLDLESFLQGFL